MNTSSKISGLLLVTGSLLLAHPVFAQGPLTPPGPPAPTMKTLDQIDAKLEKRIPISSLPSNLTVSGSYYLTQNLTGVAGEIGILIGTSNVTIDLNGFALIGVPGSQEGIVVAPGARNIAIRNGIIRNWGGSGVGASGLLYNGQFERLLVSDNAAQGIRVGFAATVRDCVATGNNAAGISALAGARIVDCVSKSNDDAGIEVGERSTVTGCTAEDNETGIILGAGSSASNCTAGRNTLYGISAAGGNTTITNCTASENSFIGIMISSGTVAGCTASSNESHGITAGSGSLIVGNTCSFNGAGDGEGAGIRFGGNGSRIEGNNCYSNDLGIQSVPGTNFFIVRNSCRDHSGTPINPGATANYDFDRDTNTYGPVIVVNGDMSANPATSHPAANIQY